MHEGTLPESSALDEVNRLRSRTRIINRACSGRLQSGAGARSCSGRKVGLGHKSQGEGKANIRLLSFPSLPLLPSNLSRHSLPSYHPSHYSYSTLLSARLVILCLGTGCARPILTFIPITDAHCRGH